jgi:hypothetical protein
MLAPVSNTLTIPDHSFRKALAERQLDNSIGVKSSLPHIHRDSRWRPNGIMGPMKISVMTTLAAACLVVGANTACAETRYRTMKPSPSSEGAEAELVLRYLDALNAEIETPTPQAAFKIGVPTGKPT